MSPVIKIALLSALIVALILFWVAFYYFLQDIGKTQKTELTISRGGTIRAVLNVETALDPFSQAKGLSGRHSLSNSDGMLFVFDASKTRRFWMMGMCFPLDIIWISDGAVIGIEYDAKPYKIADGTPTQFESPAAINEVLEIPAGAAEKMGIQIGDRIAAKK